MNINEVQRMKQRFRVIGNSPELDRAIDIAMQVAPTDLSVLISGESGAGKDIFPRIIHENSLRKTKKLLAVNCGAIPEGTIDSELFGHEKGSFTGAVNDRKGYFAEANGGTVFLDEVAELPLATQARLLRVLESGEYIKVGSSVVERTDVRIVAATNVNLQDAIEKGKFREDLYYRLCTIPIKVPALRSRPQDIALLFRKFAADCVERYQMPPISLTDEAKQLLMSYSWPGNVRQLKHITEQISVLSQQRTITREMLEAFMPIHHTSMVPAVVENRGESKSYENELRILYGMIVEMKNKISELSRVVDELSGKSSKQMVSSAPLSIIASHTQPEDKELYHAEEEHIIQEATEYEEDTSLTLEQTEREAIKRALQRHNGKRRSAAQDLKTSERTLYRKIKKYNIEE